MVSPYKLNEIKLLLDKKVEIYNHPDFIETDPIAIPHRFSLKEDIEIAGFLTAIIAWGQRCSIIKSASILLSLTGNNPYNFITEACDKDFAPFKYFKHRTFQGDDCIFFLKSLQHIYINKGGLEKVFTEGYNRDGNIKSALDVFYDVFFSTSHPLRSRKHIANVRANASAKRLNMFLRWMVRDNSTGVDFGLWKNIPSSALMIPLDVHTGNVSRKLGLLKRKQNDWKAVEELTAILRIFDPADPVKYDFALFGMGAVEKIY